MYALLVVNNVGSNNRGGDTGGAFGDGGDDPDLKGVPLLTVCERVWKHLPTAICDGMYSDAAGLLMFSRGDVGDP